MSSRKLIEYTSQKDKEINVESEKPSNMVYISRCQGCTFIINKQIGKLYIEKSIGCKIVVNVKVMSSLLEVYKCKDIILVPDVVHQLHTVTIEATDGVVLQLKKPNQLQRIVIMSCVNLKYCLVYPYPLESIPDLSKCDDSTQYLLNWEGGSTGKLAVNVLTRRGGYLSTVEQAEIMDKKQEEAMDKMMEMVIGTVQESIDKKVGNKPPAATGGKIASNTGDTASSGKEEACRPLVESTQEFQQKLGNMKDKLKPTETVVRDGPVIPGSKPGANSGAGRQYNIEDEEQKKEFVDSAKDLDKKVKMVAKFIREGKHVIFFTGAGISTSAGIPDFRSGMNTMLETGPGVWELRAHGQAHSRRSKPVKLISALPTVTHMSMVALHEAGLIKFTVSQNVDGLHRRSGMNPKQLAELHGNTNLESCSVCGVQYLRDFETREAFGVFNHETTRRCDDPACGNILLDSIINFGEQLPENEIKSAFDHGGKADVCVVLGSSLTVQPAATIPATVGSNRGKLVICNLQKTPLYNLATINVHSMCDVFMKKLVEDELKIPIPSFKLKRRAKLSFSQISMTNDWEFRFQGLDVFEDIPYSIIQG
ncbi:hypothetical protein LOD99_12606 [Oopsacas minuta]|uniref:Regulatory protein SIR2 homolog 7 n=1 Tax=Oopsacas minuta TaxID=111878 RepID=A0AAV7JCH7_9METZ|nr:hypothetical protein LOD99_12606 [Oopsacas minuta]